VNILVLANVDADGLRDWDVVADQVAAALRQRGHSVDILGVGPSVRPFVEEIERRKPELCFNLVEQVGDYLNGDVAIAAILDLMGIPYTGSGPGELYLASDKALGKKLLAFEDILYPRFAVFSKDAALETGGNLRMPLFVKPLKMDASIGIDGDALVRDSNAMMRRVLLIHDEIGDDALAEEYIDGRELYVGVVGNQKLQALPVWELFFTNMPADARRIATDRVKWSVKYQKKYGIDSGAATELTEDVSSRIQHVCKRAFRALELSGYARIDLRLDETGHVWLLEANPNPQIAKGEDFAASAEKIGIGYDALLQRILNLGLRWQPESAA